MAEKKQADPRVNIIRGFYIALFRKLYGFAPVVNYAKSGAVIKRLLKDFSEHQCYLLICLHFSWKGIDDKDEFTHKRLKDRAFPIEWIAFNVNPYQAYIRNVLSIDFDNEDAVKKAVQLYLSQLSK